MYWISRFWIRATLPSPKIRGPLNRQQAALVASLFLGLMFIGTLAQVISVIAAPPAGKGASILGGLFTLALAGFAYWISRSRFYLVAAASFIIVFDLLILATGARISNPDILLYLLIPALFSSVFISTRVVLMLTGINLIGAALIISRTPGLDPIDGLSQIIAPLLMVTLLFIIVTRHRDNLETEQRAELQESHERYQTLVESTFEGVITVQDGRIVEANRGFIGLFGDHAPTVIGQPIDVFIPEAKTLLDMPLSEVPPREVQGITANGQRLEIELVARPYTRRGESGHVMAMRDVSEKKLAEAALQQAQRLESLGLLAGGIAHDFNNVLTGILMQGSLALRKLAPTAAAQSHVQKMVDSAERASQLTRQLLAYAGKGQIAIALFDINALIRDSRLFLGASLSRRVELRLRLAETPLFMQGDTGQIQQILLNLVLNAAEAMEDRPGQITITTTAHELMDRQQASRYLHGVDLSLGHYVRLEVQDTGKGMEPDTLRRVFDPFFTTQKTGHGLGLASTLGIIRAHHGAVAVDSAPNQGTRFSILLPRAEGTATEAPAAEETPPVVASTEATILIIEDENALRDALSDSLRLLGWQVLAGANGREGLQLLLQHTAEIDVAVLDLHMPAMDGFQTLQVLRVIDPTIAVVISSSPGELEGYPDLLANRQIVFLPKPFTLEQLITAVNQVLAGD